MPELAFATWLSSGRLRPFSQTASMWACRSAAVQPVCLLLALLDVFFEAMKAGKGQVYIPCSIRKNPGRNPRLWHVFSIILHHCSFNTSKIELAQELGVMRIFPCSRILSVFQNVFKKLPFKIVHFSGERSLHDNYGFCIPEIRIIFTTMRFVIGDPWPWCEL